jgi:superfamily II DNA/RNA helicase
MDIFKKLTKGISFDPKNGPLPQQISPAINETNGKKGAKKEVLLPVELDFFASESGVVSHENESKMDSMTSDGSNETTTTTTTTTNTTTSNTTNNFKCQEDLETFKAQHGIRLALHQSSESSSVAGAATGASGLHHLVELEDAEQILPVRSFGELVEFCGLDGRLISRLEQVAREEEEDQKAVREKRSNLLLPSNESQVSRIITEPTAVQMQATPVILKGRDLICMAPTGSGKTLAFVLGIYGRLLNDMDKSTKDTTIDNNVKALIIAPTRELADQIHSQFMKFSPRDEKGKVLLRAAHLNKSVVNGWTAQRPQTYPHVLISTPLRLIHALRADLLSIADLRVLVLDEADRLLADGFDEQLDELLVAMKTPAKVQKALFSATMPSGVESTARTILSAPYRIVCGLSANSNGSTLQSIEQHLIFCGNGNGNLNKGSKRIKSFNASKSGNSDLLHDESVGKLMALRQLIHQGSLTPPVIIFVGSSVRAERLFSDLIKWSASALNRPLPIDYLHAGRTQSERSSVLQAFRSGKIWFLITTDVLARGLDFPPLSAVINYDFPDSAATYIHRIGRTGRAGRSGAAYTFYTSDDLPNLRIVVNVMRESGCQVQQWLQDHYTKSQGSSRLAKKLKHSSKNAIKSEKIEDNN